MCRVFAFKVLLIMSLSCLDVCVVTPILKMSIVKVTGIPKKSTADDQMRLLINYWSKFNVTENEKLQEKAKWAFSMTLHTRWSVSREGETYMQLMLLTGKSVEQVQLRFTACLWAATSAFVFTPKPLFQTFKRANRWQVVDWGHGPVLSE